MYAPPPSIDAELFVRIPERFHISGRKSAWVDVQLHGASAPVFLEGPSFDHDGNLWLVDIPWGRLFKVTPSGDVSCELEYDGWPNGLKFHRDGRAFITDAKNGIMVFDPRTRKIEPFIDKVVLTPFKGVNDLIFSSKGELFFTDQGQTGLHDPSGRLYRVGTDGKVECLLANIPSPNGLVLSSDENMVFLAVTRDNAIWRVPLLHGGGVTKVGVFIQLSGGGGPDGLAMDEQGGIVVCHVGLGSVWLFDDRGEPKLRIKSPTGYMTTNCAFGGPQNRQLFITENQSVLVAEMPVAGRRMYSHH
jgi:gluconolactonase